MKVKLLIFAGAAYWFWKNYMQAQASATPAEKDPSPTVGIDHANMATYPETEPAGILSRLNASLSRIFVGPPVSPNLDIPSSGTLTKLPLDQSATPTSSSINATVVGESYFPQGLVQYDRILAIEKERSAL